MGQIRPADHPCFELCQLQNTQNHIGNGVREWCLFDPLTSLNRIWPFMACQKK